MGWLRSTPQYKTDEDNTSAYFFKFSLGTIDIVILFYE